jgi:tetratricopeptide (TPR) repeat protein
MGWFTLAAIGFAAAALLVALRVPRLLWSLVASFLMLGAAGYAYQGQPALAAQPVVADAVKYPVDPAYKEMRDAMFGRFGGESIYFGISDSQLNGGDTRAAASVLIGAVQYAPKNAALWTELGNALALNDHGAVSPSALFAFNQAMRLSPQHPGPPFFLGFAYLREGQPIVARQYWARALALTPPQAEYHGAIADRLAALDSYLAQAGAAPPPQ